MANILSVEKLALELYPFPSKRKHEIKITIENRVAFINGYKCAEKYIIGIDKRNEKNLKIQKAALKTICDFYKVSLSYLQTKSRAPKYSDPRMFYYVLMKSNSSLSFTEIGAIFSQPHSTVINALKRNKNFIFSDKNHCEKLSIIESNFIKNLNN